ncbi:hypothetical protein OH146_13440 [Salinibacterium sp. SYSU T00001]|uniref:hypothetical protein n=1 Tax=Homoserinimonas sedimenticola TaxID=2986805 RepID=UPI0022365DEE|nr:hypothetical protein [Salinibacterium sedimenticola]MCW4386778.1 hypothetical protein [Salinibacterium sedimenticola]
MSTTATSSASSSAAPRLRLTRRGRIVFTTLAATPLVVIALLLGLNGGMATATNSSGAPLESVTISAGQSLWAVASEVAPNEDPREVIARFVEVNQLDSVEVVPGQRLFVPAAYSG